MTHAGAAVGRQPHVWRDAAHERAAGVVGPYGVTVKTLENKRLLERSCHPRDFGEVSL
jgi:hypothetical protein